MNMIELAQSLFERRASTMSPEAVAEYRKLLSEGQHTLVVIDLLTDGLADGNLTDEQIEAGAEIAAQGRLLKSSAYFAESLSKMRSAA